MPRARGASAASSGNSRPRTTHKLPSSAQLDARRSRLYRGVRNRCGHRGGRPGRTDSGGPAHLAAEPQSGRRRLDIARQQPEPRQLHPSNARGGRALGRACLARTLLALATRATSEAEAWLVAPSGEVLESEESTMLCEVCELLGRLERNGSLRGHIASGLIDLVRACSRGPSPWLPPFYAGGTSPLARSARRLGRRRAPWRACRPRPRAAQAGLARNFQNLERNLRQRP